MTATMRVAVQFEKAQMELRVQLDVGHQVLRAAASVMAYRRPCEAL